MANAVLSSANLRGGLGLVAPVLASYVKGMPMTSKVFLAVVLGSFLILPPALAQQRSYDIMVEEGGKPLKRSPKSVVPDSGGVKKAPKQRVNPRGSSYVPPTNLPRTKAIVTSPPPGVYTPPPITTSGDRATNAIHSYPLQQGIGNNPTDMQMYIRQKAN
jgi:hypothetical protein